MRQEFRDSGKAIAGGVQREFVNGAGDDGVDLTGEREPGGGLDALRGRPSRLELGRRAAPILPPADNPHIRVKRLAQCFPHYFRTDASRVADGHRQAWPGRSHG